MSKEVSPAADSYVCIILLQLIIHQQLRAAVNLAHLHYHSARECLDHRLTGVLGLAVWDEVLLHILASSCESKLTYVLACSEFLRKLRALHTCILDT